MPTPLLVRKRAAQPPKSNLNGPFRKPPRWRGHTADWRQTLEEHKSIGCI